METLKLLTLAEKYSYLMRYMLARMNEAIARGDNRQFACGSGYYAEQAMLASRSAARYARLYLDATFGC